MNLILVMPLPLRASFAFESDAPLVFAPKYVTPLPDSELAPSIPDAPLFLEGVAALKAGRASRADSLLGRVERMNGLMQSHAVLLRAFALLSDHRADEAMGLAERLLEDAKTGELGVLAVLECLRLGEPRDPGRRSDLLAKAQARGHPPELLARKARHSLLLKDTAGAFQALEQILKLRERTPWQDTVTGSFDSLVTGGNRPPDEKTWVLAQYLEWRMAWPRLLEVADLVSSREGPWRERFLWMALNASMRQKKYEKALAILGRLGRNEKGPSLLYNRAVCLERLKEYRSAAGLYRKYMALYPKGGKTDVILWDNARRLEDRGDFQKAVTLFRRLYETFPKESLADKAAFKAPFCLYKAGSADSAAAGFIFCEKKYGESSQADGCPYWVARCFESLKNPDSAGAWLVRTVTRNSFSFYGFRAADRLAAGGFAGATLPAPAPSREFGAFLDSLGKNARPLSKEAADHFMRGVLLARCGLAGLAQAELRKASAEADRDPRFLYRLVRTYETFGFFTEAYRLSRHLIQRIPEEEFGGLPPEILKIFFPRYFGEAVDLECQKYGLDPLFVHSIMRQESAYNAEVLSRAGAVGLLQLMPATAEIEARRMGLLFTPDSLSNPLYNIRVGVYHVTGLLDKLDHSKALTLAAYNAGINATRRWMDRTPISDLDRFIEDIGYTETRNYVKKCMRNYWAYRRIWLP